MRWQTLRLHRFGGLRDFEAKLAPFTVLLGPNEAGKTTLRHALLTLLLGFRQRKGFPWSPWDGSEPHLEGVLEMETDSWTVVRRLLSQPRGHLLGAQGKRRELGNQPLPFLTSQMELLYEDVYTLTAANLVMLKGDLWHQVEEALMGGLQGHLLPVATVRETIVREHESLWHVHKNKGAAARRLLARRQELHQRLLEARGKEEELFRLEEGLNLLEGKMRQVEESLRAEEEREKERIRLESLARRLETVVEKEREAGPLELLAGLPPDPLRTLEMLLHKEEDLRTRWEEKKTYVEELGAAAALSPFERELWARREEVAQVLPVLENLRRHRVELADLEPRLQQVERELGPAAERLFLEGSLEKGSLLLSAEGEGRFRRWLAAREERRERERRRREEEEGEARRRREEAALRPLLYLGLGLLGAGILLFFALDAGGLYLGGGGLFALFLWAVLRGRGLADPYLARLVEGEERARQEEKEALAELASTLQPLALAPSLAESLSADELESRFSALRNLLLEREGLLLEKGRREEACRQGEAVLLRLWESLPSPPPQRTYEDLPELFHQTREKAQRALEALEKREGALTEWQEIEAQWKALREHLGALQERFRALAPEAEAGAREAERRLQALQEARILKEELERDGGPLEAIRKAVEKARREGLFAPQEGLKEELQRERGKLQEERDALLARRAELAQGPEPSLLLAQMEEVEEELRRIRRRRDRLFLLQRILEEGQRRFRETFQPETLRLASVYLSSFTGGRYRRLFMDEEEGPPGFGQEGRVDKKGPQLMVEGPDGSFPAAFPLSQGTLHQIYLALRLGLLSHLEGEGEPLPLLLDETLVHFDGQRREATWNILRQVAEHRQVLYFTCHPSMAREAMVKGALLIELPSRQTMP